MAIHTKNGKFVVIDIGSSKIAGIVAEFHRPLQYKPPSNLQESQPEYGSIIATTIHASHGIKQGHISDTALVTEAIRTTLADLEAQLGDTIEEVVVSLPSSMLRSHHFRLRTSIPHGQVRPEDVRRLLAQCSQLLQNEAKERVIHSIPLSYQLTDAGDVDNPVGMFGSPLTAKVHCITGLTEHLMTLTHCFAHCQVEIQGFVASAYAAGLAVLTQDERNQGATLIDIGAGSIDICQWRNNKCSHLGYAPLGGNHITADIAHGLSLNWHHAEQIKNIYGNATVIARDIHQVLDLPFLKEDATPTSNHRLPITQAMLGEIIHPRVEEMGEIVNRVLRQSHADKTALSRLVVTGGSSALLGINDVLEPKIGSHGTRLGQPLLGTLTVPPAQSTHHDIDALRSPIFSVAVGLVKFTLYQLTQSGYDGQNNLVKHSPWARALAWMQDHL